MTTTTGRVLALNLAATDDRDEVRRLIQEHLNLYPRDEALHILAIALATLAGDILAPAVAGMAEADEWRNQHTQSARKIIAGPTQEEN